MIKPVVVNIRSYQINGRPLIDIPFDQWPSDLVYIGRSGRGLTGAWGNPIAIGQVCPMCSLVHQRAETLRCYETMMRSRLLDEPSLQERIMALSGKKLVCFCAPKSCHGDVLSKIFNEIAGYSA